MLVVRPTHTPVAASRTVRHSDTQSHTVLTFIRQIAYHVTSSPFISRGWPLGSSDIFFVFSFLSFFPFRIYTCPRKPINVDWNSSKEPVARLFQGAWSWSLLVAWRKYESQSRQFAHLASDGKHRLLICSDTIRKPQQQSTVGDVREYIKEQTEMLTSAKTQKAGQAGTHSSLRCTCYSSRSKEVCGKAMRDGNSIMWDFRLYVF